MAVLAREGGSLKVTVHQLPSTSLSPLTTLAPARNVPLPEQQYDVFFMAQVRSCRLSHDSRVPRDADGKLYMSDETFCEKCADG